MKKVVIVTRVNDYWPEMCEYTIPNLKVYAESINADFVEITERKNPTFHPAYEKLQAHEIAKYYDKSLLIDADILIHPRVEDLTNNFGLDNIASWMTYKITDPRLTLWDTSNSREFQRDGRNLGIVGSMVGCSKYTCDVFKPLPVNFTIPTLYRPAIVDEYVMSLNTAKYGLKHVGLTNGIGIYHAEVTTKNDPNSLNQVKKLSKEWKA